MTGVLVSGVLVSATLALAAPPASGAPPAKRPALTAAQRQALAAGLQIAPKQGRTAKATGSRPNPYLANLPDAATADYSGWQARMDAAARTRGSSSALRTAKVRAAGRALAAAVVHDEEEPAGTTGSNDRQSDAEPIAGFGTRAGQNPRVRILGGFPDLRPTARTIRAAAEDNGQLSRAAATGIRGEGAVVAPGVLGDGPHGSSGDGTNDFDFYRLESSAGLSVTIDTSGSPLDSSGSPVDTVVGLYDAHGELLAVDDDGGDSPASSKLTFPVTTSGTYYALVAGYSENGPLPDDPTDSGSGAGGAVMGPYRVAITSTTTDSDFYGVQLQPGDVVGASVTGAGSQLRMYRTDGVQMIGSEQDASSIYPAASPLPGGGNAVLAYVAERAGRYALRVDGGLPGAYDVTLEVYRPGTETDRSVRVQTVFLDFDGARVNTGIWGGPGVRTLSPFGAFVAKWGLSRSQEATLVDRITDGVRENIRQDLIQKGLNKNVSVRVVNSRTSADFFGQPNVSRVIVGGTIEQSGVETIGIAQSIDPGNYAHEETALVLLDVLSGPADDEASLNHYMTGATDRPAFVSHALANVISHEIGHFIGNFHTDNDNTRHSLMDAGGANFGTNLYGVGPDGIGGTADDPDIDYITDTLSPPEGLTGQENTLNVASWAFVTPRFTP